MKVSNVRNVKKVKAEPKELIRIVKKTMLSPGHACMEEKNRIYFQS